MQRNIIADKPDPEIRNRNHQARTDPNVRMRAVGLTRAAVPKRRM